MARTRLVASTAASAACAAAALMGCCLALLAVTVPSALASARPGTPDDFLGLLLWAQAASERAAAAAASAPADAMEAVEAAVAAAPPPPPPSTARQLAVDWRDKHRALFRKASEGGASADGGSGLPPKKAQLAAKKHAPAPKTTTSAAPAPTTATATAPTPVTSTATAVPAPALWAPEESVSRAAVPALEEYDRSERFGHSFVHGFRPF